METKIQFILCITNLYFTVITATYMRDDGSIGMQCIQTDFGQCLMLLNGRLQLTT